MTTRKPQSKMSRRTFLLAARNLALGMAMTGGTLYGGYLYAKDVEPNWLAVKRLTLPIRGLPASLEGLRLVQMSDFHLRPVTTREQIQRAVDLANALKPDVIALTGDYVTNDADDIHVLAPVLGGLNAKHGVYSILGNHELWTNADVVTAALRRAGLPVLINDGVALSAGRGQLYLAGLDDLWSGAPDLGRALADRPGDAPVVLLAHEPDFADEIANDPRISLQLSGHSHGGQVRVPGYGAIAGPPYGRKYIYGLCQIRDLWLYTNPGIGLAIPGIRINCRPEVTEITLSSA